MFRMRDYGFITDIKSSNKGVKVSGYYAWKAMINRCYNKNDRSYKSYGGKGVYVCDEWKLFSNFKEWYDKNNPTGELQMDKDMSGKGYYGPDSVIFISLIENVREEILRLYGNFNEVYHINTPYQRGNFKRKCKSFGWNFDDFEEIKTDKKAASGAYLYIYVKK